MRDKVGLLEAVSFCVGGMVGGGIFAVLGVVAAGAGTSAWIAFAISGFIAISAGFSFVRLNNICTDFKSPIGQIEDVSGSPRIAGMVDWLLTFGYIGTMAMYAFAFGGYLQGLLGIEQLFGVPTRPIFSVLCVILFGSLNLLGAHTSGKTEDTLVISKILILLVFAISGIIYGLTHKGLSLGIKSIGVSSLTVVAISFVAFEGWELLMFDQNSIINPRQTIRKAIYISLFLERHYSKF